uniref:Uncharacterized protein n=1 Tax=Physcomitrium patens TaxID=3218 RepID=A0A2K1L9N4_PHYPA|nr:hypothetical protein PHYPA_001147 [Physcomitrium patens]
MKLSPAFGKAKLSTTLLSNDPICPPTLRHDGYVHTRGCKRVRFTYSSIMYSFVSYVVYVRVGLSNDWGTSHVAPTAIPILKL